MERSSSLTPPPQHQENVETTRQTTTTTTTTTRRRRRSMEAEGGGGATEAEMGTSTIASSSIKSISSSLPSVSMSSKANQIPAISFGSAYDTEHDTDTNNAAGLRDNHQHQQQQQQQQQYGDKRENDNNNNNVDPDNDESSFWGDEDENYNNDNINNNNNIGNDNIINNNSNNYYLNNFIDDDDDDLDDDDLSKSFLDGDRDFSSKLPLPLPPLHSTFNTKALTLTSTSSGNSKGTSAGLSRNRSPKINNHKNSNSSNDNLLLSPEQTKAPGNFYILDLPSALPGMVNLDQDSDADADNYASDAPSEFSDDYSRNGLLTDLRHIFHQPKKRVHGQRYHHHSNKNSNKDGHHDKHEHPDADGNDSDSSSSSSSSLDSFAYPYAHSYGDDDDEDDDEEGLDDIDDEDSLAFADEILQPHSLSNATMTTNSVASSRSSATMTATAADALSSSSEVARIANRAAMELMMSPDTDENIRNLLYQSISEFSIEEDPLLDASRILTNWNPRIVATGEGTIGALKYFKNQDMDETTDVDTPKNQKNASVDANAKANEDSWGLPLTTVQKAIQEQQELRKQQQQEQEQDQLERMQLEKELAWVPIVAEQDQTSKKQVPSSSSTINRRPTSSSSSSASATSASYRASMNNLLSSSMAQIDETAPYITQDTHQNIKASSSQVTPEKQSSQKNKDPTTATVTDTDTSTHIISDDLEVQDQNEQNEEVETTTWGTFLDQHNPKSWKEMKELMRTAAESASDLSFSLNNSSSTIQEADEKTEETDTETGTETNDGAQPEEETKSESETKDVHELAASISTIEIPSTTAEVLDHGDCNDDDDDDDEAPMLTVLDPPFARPQQKLLKRVSAPILSSPSATRTPFDRPMQQIPPPLTSATPFDRPTQQPQQPIQQVSRRNSTSNLEALLNAHNPKSWEELRQVLMSAAVAAVTAQQKELQSSSQNLKAEQDAKAKEKPEMYGKWVIKSKTFVGMHDKEDGMLFWSPYEYTALMTNGSGRGSKKAKTKRGKRGKKKAASSSHTKTTSSTNEEDNSNVNSDSNKNNSASKKPSTSNPKNISTTTKSKIKNAAKRKRKKTKGSNHNHKSNHHEDDDDDGMLADSDDDGDNRGNKYDNEYDNGSVASDMSEDSVDLQLKNRKGKSKSSRNHNKISSMSKKAKKKAKKKDRPRKRGRRADFEEKDNSNVAAGDTECLTKQDAAIVEDDKQKSPKQPVKDVALKPINIDERVDTILSHSMANSERKPKARAKSIHASAILSSQERRRQDYHDAKKPVSLSSFFAAMDKSDYTGPLAGESDNKGAAGPKKRRASVKGRKSTSSSRSLSGRVEPSSQDSIGAMSDHTGGSSVGGNVRRRRSSTQGRRKSLGNTDSLHESIGCFSDHTPGSAGGGGEGGTGLTKRRGSLKSKRASAWGPSESLDDSIGALSDHTTGSSAGPGGRKRRTSVKGKKVPSSSSSVGPTLDSTHDSLGQSSDHTTRSAGSLGAGESRRRRASLKGKKSSSARSVTSELENADNLSDHTDGSSIGGGGSGRKRRVVSKAKRMDAGESDDLRTRSSSLGDIDLMNGESITNIFLYKSKGAAIPKKRASAATTTDQMQEDTLAPFVSPSKMKKKNITVAEIQATTFRSPTKSKRRILPASTAAAEDDNLDKSLESDSTRSNKKKEMAEFDKKMTSPTKSKRRVVTPSTTNDFHKLADVDASKDSFRSLDQSTRSKKKLSSLTVVKDDDDSCVTEESTPKSKVSLGNEQVTVSSPSAPRSKKNLLSTVETSSSKGNKLAKPKIKQKRDQSIGESSEAGSSHHDSIHSNSNSNSRRKIGQPKHMKSARSVDPEGSLPGESSHHHHQQQQQRLDRKQMFVRQSSASALLMASKNKLDLEESFRFDDEPKKASDDLALSSTLQKKRGNAPETSTTTSSFASMVSKYIPAYSNIWNSNSNNSSNHGIK